MTNIKSIVAATVLGATALGFSGCNSEDNYQTQENMQQEQTIERKTEYFKDMGIIGGGYNDFSGDCFVALGDMDGDGDLDVIVSDRFARVHYLENQGKGKFTDRGKIGGGYNDFSGVSRIAIGDVNQDGRQDVILTDRFARVAYIENNIPQKNQE